MNTPDAEQDPKSKGDEKPVADANESRQERDFRRTVQFFLVFTVLALLAVLLIQWPFMAIATALLWAFGCMSVGATIGFLFGVPKILQPTTRNSPQPPQRPPPQNAGSLSTKDSAEESRLNYEVNTNLTEISDWLTKIIVGVGLIELKEMPGFWKRLSTPLANVLDPASPNLAVASAISVCFTVIGFLFGYVCTRLFLTGAFVRADRSSLQDQIQEAAHRLERLEATTEGLDNVTNLVTQKAVLDPTAPDRKPGPAEKSLIEFASARAEEKPEVARSFSDWYVIATRAFTEGRFPEAIRHLEMAIKTAPPGTVQWEVYNLLALAYHYTQSDDWELGDDRTWFVKAVENYTKAIAIAPGSAERLLAQANLSFVYLDAEEYQRAAETAEAVLKQEEILGAHSSKTFELARIALSAAAVMTGDSIKAHRALNEARGLMDFKYLITQRDITDEIIAKLRSLSELKAEAREFLS